MDTTWNSNRRSLPTILFIAGILFLLVLGMLLAVAVQTNSHAVLKHGEEAITIRKCLEKNGEYQTWKSRTDPFKFFRICKLGPNSFGLQIVQCLTTGVCEKTAFVKGDGTWAELTRYLSKMATRFNGTIP